MANQNYDPNVSGEILRLVEQSIWANRQWIEFVYSQTDTETRPKEILCHIMCAERVWFERIFGERKTRETFFEMDKEELLKAFDENRQTFQALISARLGDIIHFKRFSGEEYHSKVIDIIYHLLTHGYHHRGQLAAHYARKGLKYPNTDHINYLLENKL